jgi:hypothetical protein
VFPYEQLFIRLDILQIIIICRKISELTELFLTQPRENQDNINKNLQWLVLVYSSSVYSRGAWKTFAADKLSLNSNMDYFDFFQK